MRAVPTLFGMVTLLAAITGCGDDDAAGGAGTGRQTVAIADVTFESDAELVRDADDALPGVFIQPFLDCRPALDGEPQGAAPDGQVCTHVAISGATEPGRYFPDYASCDVVRTQRPYWPAPPASEPPTEDPRLQDAALVAELAWARQQLRATACTCCHDSTETGEGKTSQWDIAAGPLWLDTLSDSGLSMFAGLADSSALGAYPAPDNNGFDRTALGVPTTDIERMRALLRDELSRRGISDEEAQAVSPFGGPIYQNLVTPPTECGAGEGVDEAGRVTWKGSLGARYLYVMAEDSDNVGVPPNLDNPDGTLWRLDVLPNAKALQPGVVYGTTPAGSYQATPSDALAPALQPGTRYHFAALLEVGFPLSNCVFSFGEPAAPSDDISAPSAADMEGGGGQGGYEGGVAGMADGPAEDPVEGGQCATPVLGSVCSSDADCGCDADYCAIQPGNADGNCTRTGCLQDPTICPADWGCLDISVFLPGGPNFCVPPDA